MRKVAPWAPKAGNVALAQGIIGILGAQNAKMDKMIKFNEIEHISLNLAKFSENELNFIKVSYSY